MAFLGTGPMHGPLEQRCAISSAWLMRFACWGTAKDRRSIVWYDLPKHWFCPRAAACPLTMRSWIWPRKAARPVVATHSGPAYLVRHEENGLLTYDNPGSMVWAAGPHPQRSDPCGTNGAQRKTQRQLEAELERRTRHYLELCASVSPN